MLRLPPWTSRTTRTVQHTLRHRFSIRLLATVVETAPPFLHEEGIKLRQYQEECIQSVLSYLKTGQKRLGISLATGSGKTVSELYIYSFKANMGQVIFTQLIDRVQPLNGRATQTLILAHRRELVEQAARHCARAYPGKSIDIEMGDAHASGLADITVASIRSLLSGGRLSNYDPDTFKLVLVDEAHHIVAPGYLEALKHFGLHELHPESPALVGVSATFSRFDGLRLGAVIDHIVYHKDYVDMIGEKWLSDVMFTTIKSKAKLPNIPFDKDGDFRTKELSEAVNTEETNEITVRAWLSEAADRKSSLVFCVDVNHVTSLTSMFRRHGVDAQYITGGTRKRIRGERLEAFKNRQFPVLLNCGVFTEGTDIPSVDCVLLARPTKSRNLLVQMIGRGMRLYPGKENCHVIDMVASLETGIVTVPTLFGLDPAEVVKGVSPAVLKGLQNRQEEETTTFAESVDRAWASPSRHVSDTRLDITHYDTVYDLIEDTSAERHVRALSQNAWVQVDSEKYVLTARGGMLTLAKSTDEKIVDDCGSNFASRDFDKPPHSPAPALYEVIWKHTLPPGEKTKAPYSRPRVVATGSTLTDALHAADTFAAEQFERVLITTSAPWRKTPASESQLTFLNGLRVADDQEKLTPEMITKGQAGDMLTKVKFGARGRYAKIQKRAGQRKRAEAAVHKAKELRRREEVRVGPLQG